MLPRFISSSCAFVLAVYSLTGCSEKTPERTESQMGEKLRIGPLTYNVVQSSWRTQLGDNFKSRFPQNRFLLLDVSVTNEGSSEVSLPLLTLEGANGQSYPEAANGDGVENWFGLLRTIGSRQTQQGRIVFDVPLTSYKLRVTDGGGPGSEKYAWITIPLHIDVDTAVPSPATSAPVQ